jgi:hypothetical protein
VLTGVEAVLAGQNQFRADHAVQRYVAQLAGGSACRYVIGGYFALAFNKAGFRKINYLENPLFTNI